MPYIPVTARTLARSSPLTEGELNFALTMTALTWLDQQGGMSYTNASRVVAAFECAKLEFVRRMLAIYEDRKAAEHGEVYPPI